MIDRQALAESMGYPDPETMLRDMYKTMSTAQIGKRLGISNQAALMWCRQYQVPLRSRGGANNRSRVLIRIHMYGLDRVKELTVTQLADALCVNRDNLFRLLKKHGIQVRYQRKTINEIKAYGLEKIAKMSRSKIAAMFDITPNQVTNLGRNHHLKYRRYKGWRA